MGFGNIVYLETGTGKTYIAIMLLKYLFSDKFIDYRTRLSDALKDCPDDTSQASAKSLPKIDLPPESDDDLKLVTQSEDEIKKRRDERVGRI